LASCSGVSELDCAEDVDDAEDVGPELPPPALLTLLVPVPLLELLTDGDFGLELHAAAIIARIASVEITPVRRESNGMGVSYRVTNGSLGAQAGGDRSRPVVEARRVASGCRLSARRGGAGADTPPASGACRVPGWFRRISSEAGVEHTSIPATLRAEWINQRRGQPVNDSSQRAA
jgi:hypothetical protein